MAKNTTGTTSKGSIAFGIIALITLIVALVAEGIKNVITFKKESKRVYKHSVIRNTISAVNASQHPQQTYTNAIKNNK